MTGVDKASNKAKRQDRAPCLPLLREYQRCCQRFSDKASADALFPEEAEKALSVPQPVIKKKVANLSLVYEDPYALFQRKGKGARRCDSVFQRLEACSKKHKSQPVTKSYDMRQLLAKFNVFQSGPQYRDYSRHTYHARRVDVLGTAREINFRPDRHSSRRRS